MTEMCNQVLERIRQEEAAWIGKEGETHGEVNSISSSFIMDCLNACELGDGMLFAALHKGRFIYNVSTQQWYEFSDHFWRLDDFEKTHFAVEDVCDLLLKELESVDARIRATALGEEKCDDEKLTRLRRDIIKRIKKLRSDKGRNTCLRFARSCGESSLSIKGEDFDANPWVLACENGVIDLKTGKLFEGSPVDYISKASPVEWKGIDEPAKLWENTVSQIFCDNQSIVRFVQRCLGYALTGVIQENVFFVLWGHGRNGKGLLIETVASVVGPMARAIPSEMLLDAGKGHNSSGPSPDIMALQGLRMAYASESDEGRKFSAARVKWLTGGDQLVGRNPHDRLMSYFQPSHKLFLLTNEKPVAPSGDYAFWERIKLVPFLTSFVDREPQQKNERKADKALRNKLYGEQSGILAWLIRGCLKWQEEGLNPPAEILEATAEYRRDEDIIADFIEARCTIEPGIKTKSKELYDAFSQWFVENVGSKPLSHRRFGGFLTKRFEKTRISGYPVFHGIAVNGV